MFYSFFGNGYLSRDTLYYIVKCQIKCTVYIISLLYILSYMTYHLLEST